MIHFGFVFLYNACFIATTGDLCSQCDDDHGISLDLRGCVEKDTCGAPGVIIFVITCEKTDC